MLSSVILYLIHFSGRQEISIKKEKRERGRHLPGTLPVKRFVLISIPVAKISLTSPTDVYVPTTVLLAVETKSSFVPVVGTFE